MDDDIAIKVDHLYKDFILPHEKSNSLKGAFTGLLKSKDKGKDIQHALKNISFEVKKGEFYGIVGRNGGCGKSTMLKILAGIYQPTKGTITVTGKLVPFIELGVGFNMELTGRENVYLNGALLGFDTTEMDAQYEDIVNFAELPQFMDQKLKNYSSGMQVRLAFSLAIRAKADILVFDEVLAVGDADFQRKCFNHFRELKKEKKTVVFVSHDMNAIREYCDRALLIDNSKMVAMDTANEIAKDYSRMFMKPSESEGQTTKDGKRWGNGKARYTSIDLRPGMVSDEPNSEIKCEIKTGKTLKRLYAVSQLKAPPAKICSAPIHNLRDKK